MLSFRVLRKVQPDVLLVEMLNENPTATAGAGGASSEGGASSSSMLHHTSSSVIEKLLRIVPIVPVGGDFVARPKERLLKELMAYKQVTKNKAAMFCGPEHASVQQHPSTAQSSPSPSARLVSPFSTPSGKGRGSAETKEVDQLHLFMGLQSIAGIQQYTLREARRFLPSNEEVLWRLLASICSCLHTLHFAVREGETNENPEGRSFFTFYGQLTDENTFLSVVDRDVADPSQLRFLPLVPEETESIASRPHVLCVTLDIPTSVIYRHTHHHPQQRAAEGGGGGGKGGSNSSDKHTGYQWAAEDIKAAGELVLSCMSLEGQMQGGEGYSQEFRFLLSKMTAQDPSQRPSASQIMNFQAVALRLRTWNLQLYADEQSERVGLLQEQLSAAEHAAVAARQQLEAATAQQRQDNHTAAASAGGYHDHELRERERLVRAREAKIDTFLHLYQLTTSQLDSVPTQIDEGSTQSYQRSLGGAGGEASSSVVQQQQSPHPHLDSAAASSPAGGPPQPQPQRATPTPFGGGKEKGESPQPAGSVRGSATAPSTLPNPNRASQGGGGCGGGSATPPEQTLPTQQVHQRAPGVMFALDSTPSTPPHQSAVVPESPEVSPMPKESDYGSDISGVDDRSYEPSSALYSRITGAGPTSTGTHHSRPAVGAPQNQRAPAAIHHFDEESAADGTHTNRTTEHERQKGAVVNPNDSCDEVIMLPDSSPTSPTMRPATVGPEDVLPVPSSERPQHPFPRPANTGIMVGAAGMGTDHQEGRRTGRQVEAQSNAPRRPWLSDEGTPRQQQVQHQQQLYSAADTTTPKGKSSGGNAGGYSARSSEPHAAARHTAAAAALTGDAPDDASPVTPLRVMSEKKKRSPSVENQQYSQHWMTSHLNDLESMRKELHDASSTSLPPGYQQGGNASIAGGSVLAASMLDMMDKEHADGGEMLRELRMQVPPPTAK